MAFKFENLRVWNLAMDLSDEVDVIAQVFPRRELFSLCTQIKRAADSVALNIAEGSCLQSNAEFKRFLIISNRSALEVVSCLHTAKRRKYIDPVRFGILYGGYLNLVRQIQALIRSLSKS